MITLKHTSQDSGTKTHITQNPSPANGDVQLKVSFFLFQAVEFFRKII